MLQRTSGCRTLFATQHAPRTAMPFTLSTRKAEQAIPTPATSQIKGSWSDSRQTLPKGSRKQRRLRSAERVGQHRSPTRHTLPLAVPSPATSHTPPLPSGEPPGHRDTPLPAGSGAVLGRTPPFCSRRRAYRGGLPSRRSLRRGQPGRRRPSALPWHHPAPGGPEPPPRRLPPSPSAPAWREAPDPGRSPAATTHGCRSRRLPPAPGSSAAARAGRPRRGPPGVSTRRAARRRLHGRGRGGRKAARRGAPRPPPPPPLLPPPPSPPPPPPRARPAAPWRGAASRRPRPGNFPSAAVEAAAAPPPPSPPRAPPRPGSRAAAGLRPRWGEGGRRCSVLPRRPGPFRTPPPPQSHTCRGARAGRYGGGGSRPARPCSGGAALPLGSGHRSPPARGHPKGGWGKAEEKRITSRLWVKGLRGGPCFHPSSEGSWCFSSLLPFSSAFSPLPIRLSRTFKKKQTN